MEVIYFMRKILFLILSCCLFLLSCHKKEQYGSLTVCLKDGPADYEEINIEIDAVEVYIEGKAYKDWYKLNTNKGIYNLLLFQDVSLLLATHTQLPLGRISQLRLIYGKDNTLKAGGNYYRLLTSARPGDKFSTLLPVGNVITANSKQTVLIDIDIERSVNKTGKNSYSLDPVGVCGTVGSPHEIF